MKQSLLIFLAALLFEANYAQQHLTNNLMFNVRASGQLDLKKEIFKTVRFPYEVKEHESRSFSYSVDLMIEKKITDDLTFSIGLGYLHESIAFNKFFDYQILQSGRDSTSIGVATKNYVYHILRAPVGVTYYFLKKDNLAIGIGVENHINFRFRETYKVNPPLVTRSNLNSFKYYGNSTFVYLNILKVTSKIPKIKISPYIRIANLYRRDNSILYEQSLSRKQDFFEALGISFSYYLNSKTKS